MKRFLMKTFSKLTTTVVSAWNCELRLNAGKKEVYKLGFTIYN